MNKKTKRLLENNNCREKALSQESQAVMTDLVVYLRGQNISMYHQEEVRWDIQEMVLEAENRGETIAQVIGEDYQTFCDEIVAALDLYRKTKAAPGEIESALAFYRNARTFLGIEAQPDKGQADATATGEPPQQ